MTKNNRIECLLCISWFFFFDSLRLFRIMLLYLQTGFLSRGPACGPANGRQSWSA